MNKDPNPSEVLSKGGGMASGADIARTGALPVLTDSPCQSEEEFVARFTAELLRIVGPTYIQEGDLDPQSTADYAAEVAPSYYEDETQRDEGPEECARSDYDCWEPVS